MRAHLTVSLIAVLIFTARGSVSAHDPIRSKVTWNGDIARIVNARCIRCHRPDGKGPMSLLTYQDARPYAKAIREEVLARRMPKWHAARGYGQFTNDPSLSPFEIALFVAWVDGGAIRGVDPIAREQTTPKAGPSTTAGGRSVDVGCNSAGVPAGRLLAIRPKLAEKSSAGFTLVFPDGTREILAWIRNYEAKFRETYWLRRPVDMPRGTRLAVDATGACSVELRVDAASTTPRAPRTAR